MIGSMPEGHTMLCCFARPGIPNPGLLPSVGAPAPRRSVGGR